MQKIGWTHPMEYENVLHRVKEERNIIHKIKRKKANWICHILSSNCLLKHAIEGKIEGGI
jgi:ppGpp synthetase/RelA/SpoT-type nucleotidyltranferase